MDIPGVNEDWDHQVTSFLPEMNSCADEDYFNPQELLVSSGQTTTTAASAQSPISGANAPSISPSGGSVTGGAPTGGALSPGALSQTSTNNAPPGSAGAGGGGGGGGGPGSTTGSCCENGRPIMTDPVSGQTVCSCQYDSARLALASGYSRIPTGSVGVYGTPYPSTEQNPYPSIGVDSSAFYSPLSNPYGLKDSGPTSDMGAWTSAGLQPTTGYYPYDPTLAAYGYGAGYDLAARRKNATRESTATLKAWLNEHKKNPYPTKGEKIMLAIITKMTLTQVSTWFANARRRLKKENKMTWEPKNKTDDDDDAMVSDEEKDKDDMLDTDKNRDLKDSMHHVKSEHDKDDDDDDLDDDRKPDGLNHMMMGGVGGVGGGVGVGGGAIGVGGGHVSSGNLNHHHPHHNQHHLHPSQHPAYGHHPAYSHHYQHHASLSLSAGATGYPNIKEELSGSKNQTSSDCGIPIPATKPKIWSLADTAACKTPPPSGYMIHHQSFQQQMQQQQHHQQQAQHQPPHQQHPQHNQLQLQQQQQQQSQHNNINPQQLTSGGAIWMGNYQQQQPQHQQPQQQHHHSNQQQQHPNQQQIPTHPNGGSNVAAMGMAMAANMVGINQQQQQQHHPTAHSNNPSQQQQQNPSQIQQQSQQQQHHQQQQQQQSQMNMMSNFVNSHQYTNRQYAGFLGQAAAIAAGQIYHQSGTNNNSNNTNMNQGMMNQQGAQQQHPNTPTTPTTVMQQTVGSAPHTNHNSNSQQQSMGFPDVQTDTPPQTPPNMKLPSVAANLITGSATPTTGTYNNVGNSSNNTNSNNSNHHLSSGYSSDSSPNSNSSYVGSYTTTRLQDHSPTKDYTHQLIDASMTGVVGNGVALNGADAAAAAAAAAAFKPFFKRY